MSITSPQLDASGARNVNAEVSAREMDRRLQRFLLLFAVVVLLLAPAGCGDETPSDDSDRANELISQAKALAQKAGAGEGRLNDLWTKIGKLDPAKDSTEALKMLDEAADGYAAMMKEQEAVAALYGRLAKLGVAKKLRTWAGQQKEIADLSARSTAVLQEFVAKDKVLFSLWNQLGETDRQKLIDELEGLDARSLELRTRARDLQQASKKYWQDNGLGQ